MKVHLLVFGRALCSFGGGDMPSEWPNDHRWASLADIDLVNCPKCRDVAANMPDARELLAEDARFRESLGGTFVKGIAMRDVHELRDPPAPGEELGRLIAWLQPRPAYCDRGRFVAGFEVPFVKSENDRGPRYYFDLERAKAEVVAYLQAKKINVERATWSGRSY